MLEHTLVCLNAKNILQYKRWFPRDIFSSIFDGVITVAEFQLLLG